MLIIFKWITIKSIILHSILVNYGSVHICENSNRLAPYRTASMIFTAILDLEARRKAKEASKARRRKILGLKKQQRMRQFLVKQALTFVLALLFIVVDQTVVRTVWSKPRSEHRWTLIQREWDDKDWMEHFQMGQVTFNKLCTELEHYIVRRERKYKKLWKSLREKRGSPR